MLVNDRGGWKSITITTTRGRRPSSSSSSSVQLPLMAASASVSSTWFNDRQTNSIKFIPFVCPSAAAIGIMKDRQTSSLPSKSNKRQVFQENVLLRLFIGRQYWSFGSNILALPPSSLTACSYLERGRAC